MHSLNFIQTMSTRARIFTLTHTKDVDKYHRVTFFFFILNKKIEFFFFDLIFHFTQI